MVSRSQQVFSFFIIDGYGSVLSLTYCEMVVDV